MRERGALGRPDVAAMARLFDLYYEGGGREQFERDLQDKTHVIELREGGELRGFSTLCVYGVGGSAGLTAPARVVFSGDTIIDRAYWGEQALTLAFCRFAGEIKAADPAVPLYWLLISKGHRTYRYLGVFARNYFPRHDGDDSMDLAALACTLARERFGAAYDEATGVVRLGEAATRLRRERRDPGTRQRSLPAIAGFVDRNPGHEEGDELVCVCELDEANLKSFALKAFREGRGGG